jgi:hypothetical protein
MRQALGSFLDLAPSRSRTSDQKFDTRRGWWVWSVLLAGPTTNRRNQRDQIDKKDGYAALEAAFSKSS